MYLYYNTFTLKYFLKLGLLLSSSSILFKMNLVGPFSKIVTMKHFLNPILKPVCKTQKQWTATDHLSELATPVRF